MGFSREPGVFAARQWSGAAYAAGNHRAALNASGVWRFRELLPFYERDEQIVTLGEGRTILQPVARPFRGVSRHGLESPCHIFLQYEGLNPSGSFKDNGMAGAFTHARMVGATRVICASTGNTSASMAMYAAATGMRAFVLIGSGKIAMGKLAQSLDFGARTLQIAGDFDACLKRVQQIALERSDLGVYLMNSVNPFRLEGQKAVMFRVLEALGWQAPDWIVVPGGNLGNCSAFGKAFMELKALKMIDRVPRLAVINAKGARTLDRVYNELGIRWNEGRYDRDKVRAEFERMDRAGERAHTIASAIEIARPVNLPKSLRALEFTDGVVRSVDDEDILENKALIGRIGFGCEPASAASLAGARLLISEGVIKTGERVVCIVTGHGLKDPDATVQYHTGSQEKAHSNRPIAVADDLEALVRAME
jgi:threonine synthase